MVNIMLNSCCVCHNGHFKDSELAFGVAKRLLHVPTGVVVGRTKQIDNNKQTVGHPPCLNQLHKPLGLISFWVKNLLGKTFKLHFKVIYLLNLKWVGMGWNGMVDDK